MYRFGDRSKKQLNTCCPEIREILNEAIKHVDFTILQGHRSLAEQKALYEQRKSKVLKGKHNSLPSMAVDIAPYPIDWKDEARFAHLVGLIKGIAAMKGIKIRCGCDWDMDGDIRDHDFMDYPHIEISEV